MALSSTTITLPPPSSVHLLPAVLLSHVCSYLLPKELLVTLARTAKSTRTLLSPGCFSCHPLELETFELSLLSSFGPPSSLTLQPFHRRVLSACDLSVNLHREDSTEEALDSLDHFPSCRTLSVHSCYKKLSDPELHALLHLSATLSCDGLTLDGFSHFQMEEVPASSSQHGGDRRVARAKRKRGYVRKPLDRTKQFNWKHIRLPALARLTVNIDGCASYKGGAAFIKAHTALLHLHVSTNIASGAELTAIFRDRIALPQLTHFGIYEHNYWRKKHTYSLTTLLTALAKTVVRATGKVRPLEWLTLDSVASTEVLAAAMLLPGLTRLQVHCVMSSWLVDGWTETPQMPPPFPLLQEYVLYTGTDRDEFRMLIPAAAAKDMLPFFRAVASCPLQRLCIWATQLVTISEAAIIQLGRCAQLQELELNVSFGASATTE